MTEELSSIDKKEILSRRVFAIISHPDAGKTTLTEKILLYGGAIHEAGEVKSKKKRRLARSDWMKLEQERGISVNSSVMQFQYKNLNFNLLDTPGHADFSEDTYRTLAAADSAIMLLDNAKGVELQTKKLFEVCRYRKTPVFTFINKLDREGRAPLEIMEEIEKTLNIECNPLTWPVGCGERFKGVYHRTEKKFYPYENKNFSAQKIEGKNNSLSSQEQQELENDIELLDSTLGNPSKEAFLKGEQTPVLFGSARTNFGVENFLNIFLDFAPGPGAMISQDTIVHPTDPFFSGFVFKIQANMDKKHRDRVAFIRIVSGKFKRGMYVKNERLGKNIRLTYSQKFFAEERKSIESAFAGDILGLHDMGNCLLGDTLHSSTQKIQFKGIPQFSPEHFSKIQLSDPMKRKSLQKGIRQLCEEGTIQYFTDPNVGSQDPILGAIGLLQFDVILYRLQDEYNTKVKLLPQPFKIARWVKSKTPYSGDFSELMGSFQLVEDLHHNPVFLFTSEFNLQWAVDNNSQFHFYAIRDGESIL